MLIVGNSGLRSPRFDTEFRWRGHETIMRPLNQYPLYSVYTTLTKKSSQEGFCPSDVLAK